MIARRSGAVLR